MDLAEIVAFALIRIRLVSMDFRHFIKNDILNHSTRFTFCFQYTTIDAYRHLLFAFFIHSYTLADWVSEWSASDKTIDSFLSCWLRFFFNYGRHAHTFLIIRLSCKWRIFFFLLRRKSHLDWHYFTQWGLFLWRWENFHKQTIHFSEMTLRLSFLRLLWMSLDNLRNS